MKIINDFEFESKRVLVRCDFNVPLDKKGAVADNFKIQQTLPTIRYLIDRGARVILMSHLDEIEGGGFPSLDSVRSSLEMLLKAQVKKANDCVGSEVEKEVIGLKNGEIILLENLRLHEGETKNDKRFSRQLAWLGEIYLNDAFAVCHRAHASVIGVPQYLPCGAGFLLLKEVENLDKILQHPLRPMVVLMGGAKIKTKVNFIKKISELADFVLIGSMLEKEIIQEHLTFAHAEKIIDPYADLTAKDLDEKTIEKFKEIILSAKTIFWNGPFGKIEEEKYKKGTRAVANAIIESGAFSVVGGGETIEFLNKEGLSSKFSHVSTGGGAMLAYLGGEKLPGLEALK